MHFKYNLKIRNGIDTNDTATVKKHLTNALLDIFYIIYKNQLFRF